MLLFVTYLLICCLMCPSVPREWRRRSQKASPSPSGRVKMLLSVHAGRCRERWEGGGLLSAVTFPSLFSYESFILRRSPLYTKHHKYSCHATLCYLHVLAGAAPVQLSVHVFQDGTRRTRCNRGNPPPTKSSSQQREGGLMSILNEKLLPENAGGTGACPHA